MGVVDWYSYIYHIEHSSLSKGSEESILLVIWRNRRNATLEAWKFETLILIDKIVVLVPQAILLLYSCGACHHEIDFIRGLHSMFYCKFLRLANLFLTSA